jgi:hypothetical protein
MKRHVVAFGLWLANTVAFQIVLAMLYAFQANLSAVGRAFFWVALTVVNVSLLCAAISGYLALSSMAKEISSLKAGVKDSPHPDSFSKLEDGAKQKVLCPKCGHSVLLGPKDVFCPLCGNRIRK